MDKSAAIICCGCLNKGRRMVEIGENNLRKCFSEIINENLISNYSSQVLQLCFECTALLLKFTKFKMQVAACYKTFQSYAQQSSSFNKPITRLCTNQLTCINIDTLITSQSKDLIEISVDNIKVEVDTDNDDDNVLDIDNIKEENYSEPEGLMPSIKAKKKKKKSNVKLEKNRKREFKEVILNPSDHERTTNNSMFTCSKCILTFPNENDLNDHINVKHEQTKKKKKKHTDELENYTEQEFIEVTLNEKEIKQERAMLSQRDDYVNAMFTCDKCILTFPNKDDLNDHVLVKHEQQKMSTSSDCKMENTQLDTAKRVNVVANNLLPEKSRRLYEKCYEDFVNWQKASNVPKTSLSENVILMYFEESGKKLQPSTLWTRYSMLRSVLNIKYKIDLSTYTKLIAFLKRKSEGFKGKKAKSFTTHEIKKFLNEAPSKYLLMKVALIIGIMGACRRHELYKLKFQEIKDIESAIVITITTRKTRIARTFTVTGKFAEICREYMILRPKNCHSPYFFLNYMNGKCTKQRVGLNKLGSLGKTIASYLKLPNPELYTGHCFRRSYGTLLVDDEWDLSPLHT